MAADYYWYTKNGTHSLSVEIILKKWVLFRALEPAATDPPIRAAAAAIVGCIYARCAIVPLQRRRMPIHGFLLLGCAIPCLKYKNAF